MVDEFRSGEFYESAERYDAAAPFTVLSAGLLVLGGLALLAPARAEKPARRRRAFGLVAILASVAVYLLRPQPAAVEPAKWVSAEQPVVPAEESEPAPAAEVVAETQEPEPEPKPDELLPAAEAEEEEPVADSGWHVIAEARQQSRARVDSSRPFVLLQSDEPEVAAEFAEEDEVAPLAVQPSEPVKGVVNRVELYSRRPDSEADDAVDMFEPLEADGL